MILFEESTSAESLLREAKHARTFQFWPEIDVYAKYFNWDGGKIVRLNIISRFKRRLIQNVLISKRLIAGNILIRLKM